MEVVPADPGEELGRGLMLIVKVCEGDKDHENDRKDGECEDTECRQCKQGFMELLIGHGLEIFFGSLQLCPSLKDFFTDLVLADIDRHV